jgi:tetratricopeptide (TPR) repeat protein
VLQAFWELLLHPREVDLEALEGDLDQAIAVFEELGDDLGLARAWNLLWDVRQLRGQPEEQVEIAERAVEFSSRAESPQDHSWALGNLCWSAADGDLPVTAGIELCTEHLERATNRANRAILEAFLSYLRALEGDFDSARAHMLRSRDVAEFGHPFHTGVVQLMWGRVESLALDSSAAERALRPAWEGFIAAGDGWFGLIAAVDLSRSVLAQSRTAEAQEILETIDDGSVASDPEILIKRRSTLARVLAELERPEEALLTAQEAVTLARQTEFPIFRVGALLDLVEVLRVMGRSAEAIPLLEEALTLCDEKGAQLLESRIEAMIGELAASR